MKRISLIAVALAVCTAVLMCGCSKTETSGDDETVRESGSASWFSDSETEMSGASEETSVTVKTSGTAVSEGSGSGLTILDTEAPVQTSGHRGGNQETESLAWKILTGEIETTEQYEEEPGTENDSAIASASNETGLQYNGTLASSSGNGSEMSGGISTNYGTAQVSATSSFSDAVDSFINEWNMAKNGVYDSGLDTDMSEWKEELIEMWKEFSVKTENYETAGYEISAEDTDEAFADFLEDFTSSLDESSSYESEDIMQMYEDAEHCF